jgi:cyclopropane fatty-acyl-phospholipid synthase-like methyltransferase
VTGKGAPGGPTAYDVAGRYDDAYFDDLATRYRRRTRFARRRVANVLSLLPPLRGRRVLDLGCGMGTFAVEAARRGARATGLDFSAAALPAARRIAAEEGVAAGFVQADAAAMPFAAAAFDVIVAADFTEHLDDDTLERVLSDAYRVLAAGGTLVIYTPAPEHLFERLRSAFGVLDPDPSHIGVRPAAALAAAARQAGFEVRAPRWLPSHLPVWNLLERIGARRVPLLRRRIGLVATRAAP